MQQFLANYKLLTARVDALCSTITKSLGERITCSPGCSSCCTAITVFPVEAAAMREALDNLPGKKAEEIRHHISVHADDERCPLLSHNNCLLYEARPIICRTHGLPITYNEDGQHKSDCCPLNLTDSEAISGTSVIDLDKLNHLLVAVNSLYLSHSDGADLPERLSIAEVITLQPCRSGTIQL